MANIRKAKFVKQSLKALNKKDMDKIKEMTSSLLAFQNAGEKKLKKAKKLPVASN